ncbi:MAG: hypothetical protein N3F67_00535 [Acidilobaceae archaeon]|nr:hypothetical protein [Acidilobaceae archaeon]
MRELLPIKASLFLSLSAFKPGATSRLSPAFERRLLEAAVMLEEAERAYLRGREVSEGRSSLQAFSLGSMLYSASSEVTRATGERPTLGLLAASLTLSFLKGLADGSGKPLRASLRALLSTALYRANVEESLRLLDAVEASGDGELNALLERRGISRGSVRVNALSPGQIYEALGELESGFWLNLRDLERLLSLARVAEGERGMAAGAQRAYMALLAERGIICKEEPREMLKLDQALREKGGFDRLVGAAFLALSLAALERWPWRA